MNGCTFSNSFGTATAESHERKGSLSKSVIDNTISIAALFWPGLQKKSKIKELKEGKSYDLPFHCLSISLNRPNCLINRLIGLQALPPSYYYLLKFQLNLS